MSLTSRESRARRQDFPALARKQGEHALAYLDGPGGTQVPQRVIDAISRAYSHHNAISISRVGLSRSGHLTQEP
jgi:selenocysteine lyase/cysteine desulfurase